MEDIILVMAGGHAKVVADAIYRQGNYEILGFLDQTKKGEVFRGKCVLGDVDILPQLKAKGVRSAMCCLGGVGNNQPRAALFQNLLDMGFELPTIIHPHAFVGAEVKLGAGTVVLPGAIINPGCTVGANVIVNTNAVLDHDCVVGDHVHISPGAVLGGGAAVGAMAHIGLGAKVIQCITIGKNTLVGAGALVVKDLTSGVVAYGTPAKVVRENKS